MGKYPPMKMEWTLRFGRHKTRKIFEVIESDPEWLDWAIRNTDLELDDESFEALNKRLGRYV